MSLSFIAKDSYALKEFASPFRGSPKTLRFSATHFIPPHYLLVYGGQTNDAYSNECWVYNMSSKQWKKILLKTIFPLKDDDFTGIPAGT